MTFDEFKKQIENLRVKRTEMFTSEIRSTDNYKKLCESSQSAETDSEETLLETLNKVCAVIDMPEGLLHLAYEKSTYPEMVIRDIEKNLTKAKNLLTEIF